VNEDLVGTTLAHCVIRTLLGEGGMARVYRAYQPNLDRDVAVKVLPAHYAADLNFVRRFDLEARAMAKLAHPNIVTIHDAGEDNGHLYIVMAYIAGGTLKQRMARPMGAAEVVHVVRDVAAALSYAHERGIVHRDVKPVNVLMDDDGRAVLGDFGIAKLVAGSSGLTRAGNGVGTPEYMSPEQCRGVDVDARADIYALGVVIYEMLTGRTPFVGDNYAALAHAHIYEPVPPPSRLNPRVSPAVQFVVLKALAKDPADRFQHATEMADALEQAVAAQTPVAAVARGPRLTVTLPRDLPDDPDVADYPTQDPPAVAAAPAPLYCPRCRYPNDPKQRFCSNCGLPLAPPAAAPVPVSRPSRLSGVMPAYVLCPQCSTPNRAVNRFCTHCGEALAPMGAPCGFCGQPTSSGQRFCTRCGRPLQ
jgi:serine/threonine-protein kinase